jgi:small subunit ribosomal protein S6
MRRPCQATPALRQDCAAEKRAGCNAGRDVYKAASFRNTDERRSLSWSGAEGTARPLKCALKTGERMPLYEHVFISRQDLSSAQAEGLVEHFGTVLADNGGKVVESEYWGVKTMAYKINKNRKGHYSFMKSDAPAPAVQEMERLMRLHEDVMRVLTIKVDEHEEGPSVQMQKRDDRDRGDRSDRGDRDRGDRRR